MRRILVFAIIAFALVMMSLDSTIVATALDDIQTGLRTSINWAGWTITAYSFGFVVMLPVSGKLSEHCSTDSGAVQAWFYVACGLVLLAALPIISRVPEHPGGVVAGDGALCAPSPRRWPAAPPLARPSRPSGHWVNHFAHRIGRIRTNFARDGAVNAQGAHPSPAVPSQPARPAPECTILRRIPPEMPGSLRKAVQSTN